jgi:Metallo-peptidase family M12B Reprolysin-like
MKPYKLFLIIAFLLQTVFTQAQIPQLSSYSSAPATVYLDFNGQYVVGSLWNWNGPIDAQPAVLSPDAITEIFNRVAEDFRPFNLNVTTDSTYYWNAPVFQRIRIIVTPTYQWYRAAGGVAFVGSFTFGDNTPAWVFSSLLSNNPKYVAEAISHEAGHTLGLQHQSAYDNNCIKTSEYNPGAGVGEIGWAPIMGVGYNKNLTTWHDGPNTGSCNTWQDDFTIINSAYNGFGLRPDDHMNNQANATPVFISGNAFILSGLINDSSDIDVFKFTNSSIAHLNLDAIPQNVGAGNSGANIDIKVSLLNAIGDTIARYNPSTLLNAGVDTILNPGDYYFIVDGTSNIYHSDYGSMGYYTLKAFLGTNTLAFNNFYLHAQHQDGKHLLSWSYQTDELISNIVVESSSDGLHFSELSSLNSSAKNFAWQPANNSPVYYRIKAFSLKNEKSYLSNVVHLQNKTDKKKIQIINKPGIGEMEVYSTGNFKYELFTSDGRLLQQGNFKIGANQINTGNATGLLILRYNDGNQAFSEKFLQ